jgi:hypothetical protein
MFTAYRATAMSRSSELKVYRTSFLNIAVGWVCAAICFIIGVGITAMAAQSYPAMNAVVGTSGICVSLWLAALVTTTRLIVTRTGLAYRSNLRRRFIGWDEVKSFGVGRSRTGGFSGGRVPWPTVVIHKNDGSVLVTHLAFFTARHPARIAGELAAWQRQLAPSAPASGDLTRESRPAPPRRPEGGGQGFLPQPLRPSRGCFGGTALAPRAAIPWASG